MFISKEHYKIMNGLIESSQNRNTDMLRREGGLRAKIFELQQAVIKLEAERHWFMHRLTQVEGERGQLIQSALGIKIAVPQFVPADNPEEALNNQPDLSSIGEDARDQPADFSDPEPGEGVDYSLMPGYKKK